MSYEPYKSPSELPVESATNVRWIVLVLASLTSWMLYLHRYTWNIIRPELATEYELSNTALETIFTMFYLSYAGFQIPSGIACDFFGAQIFLFAIILLWSLSLPLLGVSGNVYALGGARLLFGAAQAGAYPSLGQVTRTWFPRSVRTTVQGLVASFFGRGGGAMASIIMATLLMGYCGLSWRVALMVMAAGGLVFAVVLLILYRNRPEIDPRVNQQELELIREGEPPDQGTGGVLPFRQALKVRSFQILVFQQFMNAGADIVYTSVMGSYFLSKGISVAQMGLLVSLPLWGGAIGGVVGGYLNDWLIRRTDSRRWGRAIVGVSGKLIAAAVLLVAIAQRNAVAAGFALFVVKFFSDWTQPTVWGACTDMGGRFSATVFSINNTSGNVGALLTPLLIGPLLDFCTTVTTVNGADVRVTNYAPMFYLVAVMYVISALCWLAIDCSKSVAGKQ
jgi:sugar phosphate permease